MLVQSGDAFAQRPYLVEVQGLLAEGALHHILGAPVPQLVGELDHVMRLVSPVEYNVHEEFELQVTL
jgi:hypothetical protein